MANLPESNTFDEGVYQIEVTDPVMGGANGVSNTPLKQLASRTRWLKTWLDDVISKYAPKASPAFTGTPTAPTPAVSDSSDKLATTAFVKDVVTAGSVGFTPVQQGGGTGQGTTKVYLGDGGGGNLRAQVGGTDLGNLASTAYVQTEVGRSLPKSGGVMSGNVFMGSLNTGLFQGNGDGASWAMQNVRLASWFGIGFHSSYDDTTRVVIDTRTGQVFSKGGFFVDGQRVWDPSNFDPSSKQPSLGFAPVQQGTGVGQLTNNVKIGWTSTGRLKATVDTTDLGSFVFNDQLVAYAAPINSPTFTGIPVVPTANAGTNNDQAASTAFVQLTAGSYVPKAGGGLTGPLNWGSQSIGGNTGDNATYQTYNLRIASWFGIGFHCSVDDTTRIVFDTRSGNISTLGALRANAVYSNFFRFTEGADDTGLDHVSDGIFRVVSNGQQVATFGPGGAEFTLPVYAPTPAMADSSLRAATTAWVKDLVLNLRANSVYSNFFRFTEGADDTGLDHVSDGIFRVVSNGQQVATFGPGGAEFTLPVYAPTPAWTDSSQLAANTAWVKVLLANRLLNGSIADRWQNLAANGFSVRYGYAPSSTTGGGASNSVDATFSQAFPNACLGCFAVLVTDAGSRTVWWDAANTNSTKARLVYANAQAATATIQAFYIAIGY